MLPSWIGAGYYVFQHMIIDKRVEMLGDKPAAIGRLLNPAVSSLRSVDAASMPSLIMP
jgi:hypothetical protein